MTGLVLSNPRIQRLRRLVGRRGARRDEGVVVVEGATLLAEAIGAGWPVEVVYVAPGATVADSAGAPVFETAPGVIERVASTEHPQRVIAVVRRPATSLASIAGSRFVVVLAGVSDPGNAGTVLRSAEAAGADAVVLTAGSVDVTNPKVVRASAGALFHVPVVDGVAASDLPTLGLPLLGASATGGVPYTEAALDGPVAVVLGGEAHGIPAEVRLDGLVSIPHAGRAESLNVAMAGTVLCFEVARRRAGRSC